jgi:hypothetical protein
MAAAGAGAADGDVDLLGDMGAAAGEVDEDAAQAAQVAADKKEAKRLMKQKAAQKARGKQKDMLVNMADGLHGVLSGSRLSAIGIDLLPGIESLNDKVSGSVHAEDLSNNAIIAFKTLVGQVKALKKDLKKAKGMSDTAFDKYKVPGMPAMPIFAVTADDDEDEEEDE